jgi:tetratricopeptide (TPR) repeat protein
MRKYLVLLLISLIVIVLLAIGNYLFKREKTTKQNIGMGIKEIYQRKIIETKIEMAKYDSIKTEDIYDYYLKLIEADSTDLNNLNNFAHHCIKMNYSANDSSHKSEYERKGIGAAKKIFILADNNYISLDNAASIYMSFGRYELSDSIYNKMLDLIEKDSLIIPSGYLSNKAQSIKELREVLNDKKQLLVLYKNQTKRKIFY